MSALSYVIIIIIIIALDNAPYKIYTNSNVLHYKKKHIWTCHFCSDEKFTPFTAQHLIYIQGRENPNLVRSYFKMLTMDSGLKRLQKMQSFYG